MSHRTTEQIFVFRVSFYIHTPLLISADWDTLQLDWPNNFNLREPQIHAKKKIFGAESLVLKTVNFNFGSFHINITCILQVNFKILCHCQAPLFNSVFIMNVFVWEFALYVKKGNMILCIMHGNRNNIRLSFKIELSSQLTESQGLLLHQAMSCRYIRQFAEF